MFGRCKFRAKQRPFHAKQCTFHAKQCTFHGLSMVCPWSNFLKIWKSQIHTNSYSAQVFPSIFNCGDLYCNFGHLSSRRGQDAKKRPLWVKKHPFCKGRLKNVRGSLGQLEMVPVSKDRRQLATRHHIGRCRCGFPCALPQGNPWKSDETLAKKTQIFPKYLARSFGRYQKPSRNHHCLGVIFGEAKPSDISGSFFLLVDRGDDDTVDGSEIR